MSKFFKMVSVIFVFSFVIIGCGFERVQPGHVGIIVNSLGDDKGVSQEVKGVGRYWLGWNETLYTFPTFQQTYPWTATVIEGSPTDESFTFQSKEGVNINVDAAIQYTINPEKVPHLFQTYRKGVQELTDIVLRNMVRDSFNRNARKYGYEEIYSTKNAELSDIVTTEIRDAMAEKGVNIISVAMISSPRMPQSIVDAINHKVIAVQKAQQRENELQETIAESEKRKVAAKADADVKILQAKGEAESNKIITQSITSELLQRMFYERWDGKMPTTLVSDGKTNPSLLIGK